jgi:hypothetical protein
MVPSISVFAPLIQLVHQRTDVTEKEKKGHSSLSAGAKAGIGIGSVVEGFALIGAVFLLWSRRRQNSRSPYSSKGDSYVRNLQDYELSSRWNEVELVGEIFCVLVICRVESILLLLF